MEETKEMMLELVKKLNDASRAYYEEQNEIMTDKEFDILYDKLKGLEEQTGIVLPDSPTQKVGYTVLSSLTKVKHEYPSLSLDKTKDRGVMAKWLGGNVGVLSWKCDGLTVVLTYNDGELIRAATRGDGDVGEDVTHNAIHFKNVPRYIPDKRHIIIRGEAVVSRETFKSINKTILGDKQYKNPRGMASGATKLRDSQRSASFGIQFIPFDLTNALELGITKLSDGFDFIKSLGLTPVEWTLVGKDTIVEEIDRREQIVSELQYPTDGLVVAYNDLELCANMGSTNKYPRYAKAFKWADKLEMTILRGIEWSRAKSGQLSPVAIFDPVELDGTMVKRASVHNISMIKALKLGIGDHILVYKANMIIPQIHEDIEKRDNVEIPTKCPICGMPAIQTKGINGTSVFLYCGNDSCLEKGEKND